MNYQEIRQTLQEHFVKLLDVQKDKLLTAGRLSDQDRQGYQNTIERMDDSLNRGGSFLDEADPDFYTNAVANIAQKYEINLAPESEGYGVLTQEFKIFFRDYCRAMLDFDASFDRANFDNDRTLAKPVEIGKAINLKQAIEEFLQDRINKDRTDEKTSQGYRSELGLLSEFLGSDATLPLSRATAQSVLTMLKRMPKNRNKYDGLSLQQLLELDTDKLSMKSVKKYLSRYAAFYSWAGKFYEQGIWNNPFQETHTDIRIKDDEGRAPFTPEETTRILRIITDEKRQPPLKPHQKWGTLIAMYTGARLNEIAQLEVDDIAEFEGVLCFSINAESSHGTKKNLKTKNSRRLIPVHSELIRLGFLEYITTVKASASVRLFPALSYSVKEKGYGRALGRWMNNIFLPELGIKATNVVFHNFRHTVNSKLHNEGASELAVSCIAGHARKGVNQTVYLRKGLNPKMLKEAIETLSYEQ